MKRILVFLYFFSSFAFSENTALTQSDDETFFSIYADRFVPNMTSFLKDLPSEVKGADKRVLESYLGALEVLKTGANEKKKLLVDLKTSYKTSQTVEGDLASVNEFLRNLEDFEKDVLWPTLANKNPAITENSYKNRLKVLAVKMRLAYGLEQQQGIAYVNATPEQRLRNPYKHHPFLEDIHFFPETVIRLDSLGGNLIPHNNLNK